MAKFKVIVSDPKQEHPKLLSLKKHGQHRSSVEELDETIDGTVVDLPAHKVQIIGGSDKDGVPMSGNVHGGVRRSCCS